MTPLLAGKKVFAFDWDGTVLDSMPIKRRTFSELLAETLRPVLTASPSSLSDELLERYRALSGAPRREIVETILRERGLASTAIDFERFSSRLSEINRRELAQAPIFPDAIELMQRLTRMAHAVYISSSVPQAELSALVGARLPAELATRLSGVFGSEGAFAKGPEHVRRILQETGANRQQLLFFGDDLADARLCREAHVDCVLVDRPGDLADVIGACRMSDFYPVIRQLDGVLPS